jgi:hypothetical protein
MTMNAPGMQALSDAELDQLSERMDHIKNADALTLEGVDGLFCALISGRAWARGFLKGTRLAPEGWSDLWDSEGDGQLLSIPLVAGELDPTWPTEARAVPMWKRQKI